MENGGQEGGGSGAKVLVDFINLFIEKLEKTITGVLVVPALEQIGPEQYYHCQVPPPY